METITGSMLVSSPFRLYHPMLFRITGQLHTVVFEPKQLWTEGGEGAYFLCLEEMVVWNKSYKLDGTVSTVLSRVCVKFSLPLVNCPNTEAIFLSELACLMNQAQRHHFQQGIGKCVHVWPFSFSAIDLQYDCMLLWHPLPLSSVSKKNMIGGKWQKLQ